MGIDRYGMKPAMKVTFPPVVRLEWDCIGNVPFNSSVQKNRGCAYRQRHASPITVASILMITSTGEKQRSK